MLKALWTGTGLLLSLWSHQLFATSHPQIQQTSDLSDPVHEAIRFRQLDEKNRILLIFDIDNTLLTMPQFLGSDRWFNYHSAKIIKGDDQEFADIGALLATQDLLFSMGQMELTQPDVPKLLNNARDNGVDIMLLTARSPGFANITERELRRHGIELNAPTVCTFYFCSNDGRFDEASVKQALEFIGVRAATESARSIAIYDGTVFSAGQDKGVMLELLLSALQRERYAKVIFVDDGRHNVDAAAARGLAVPLTVFHYQRVSTAVSVSEASAGKRQLKKLRGTICETLKSPICSTNSDSLKSASESR